MKINMRHKTTVITLLTAAFIGITLSGCTTDEYNGNEQNVGQEIPATDVPTLKPVMDESPMNETPETTADESVVNETAANNSDASNKTPASPAEIQETALNSESLYEQFLNNSIAVTFDSNYTENDCLETIFENGCLYTLTEIGECVSEYYERWDKTSYDYAQYAYVECPDSMVANARNLLVKFVGLNMYEPDDDSYAVFVITEDNSQLYVTDTYECWARSETTAYANGLLSSGGSGGAEVHFYTVSAILSDGKQTSIYDEEILTGQSAGQIGGPIYGEVFVENTYPDLAVYISTIGDEKFYQYDTSYCSEEEIPLCEIYINRCHDEAGINWVTEEDLQNAIQSHCSAIGIDYSITQDQGEKAVWNDL